jgi:hypothetical protein
MAFSLILFGACVAFIFPCLFMNHLSQYFMNKQIDTEFGDSKLSITNQSSNQMKKELVKIFSYEGYYEQN